MYYYFERPIDMFRAIEERISEVNPELKVELVSCDWNLQKLGFVDAAPAVGRIHMTEEQYNELMDKLMDYEDFVPWELAPEEYERSEAYAEFLRYNWIWDVLRACKTASDDEPPPVWEPDY